MRPILLALLLCACGGTVEEAPTGCPEPFMQCMSGGDSGSVISFRSSGAENIISCETALRGVPYKGTCTIREP